MKFNTVLSYFYSRAVETYNFLTDAEVSVGDNYSIIRHSRPFVVYQGIKTHVPITVLSDKPLPESRRVFLQRRGYRTGLFGWTIGGALGGSKLPGLEVTPEKKVVKDSLAPSLISHFEKDINRLFKSEVEISVDKKEDQQRLETLLVRIPVSSGDGYFRLRITHANDPYKTIATSPVFRVGSISWSSAHPQGATLVGLVPELLVRTAFIAARTTAYASLYATFPFLKFAQWISGPWQQYAGRTIYAHYLSEEQRDRINNSVERGRQSVRSANESIYRRVPFGAVGVRTTADLLKDEEIGFGGRYFEWAAA